MQIQEKAAVVAKSREDSSLVEQFIARGDPTRNTSAKKSAKRSKSRDSRPGNRKLVAGTDKEEEKPMSFRQASPGNTDILTQGG